VRDEAERSLRELLEELGAEVPGLPNPDHADFLERTLRRRKPFTREDQGYRDALIWENVRPLVAEGFPVVFVPLPFISIVPRWRRSYTVNRNVPHTKRKSPDQRMAPHYR
jgi:PIN domain